MEYRRLGAAGVKLSEIGLGSWLTYGQSVESDAAKRCVRKAFDLGINFFDTADMYADGEAERALGEILTDFRRSDYVLATKCFLPVGEGPNDQGLSRKHIFESVEGSLKRLRTDYLDLYQCHRYDPDTPLEETVRAMDDMVHQGKVLYWGVSQWSAVEIKDAVGIARQLNLYRPQSNQPIYNMLNRSLEGEVLDVCEGDGLGLVVYSPLSQGVLTGKYKPGDIPKNSRAANPQTNTIMQKRLTDESLTRVARLTPIAERLGLTMPQLALAWCLRQPAITSVIIGASRPEQVEDNVGAVGVTLPGDALAEIDEALGV